MTSATPETLSLLSNRRQTGDVDGNAAALADEMLLAARLALAMRLHAHDHVGDQGRLGEHAIAGLADDAALWLSA